MKTINIVAGGPKNLIPDLTGYTDEHTLWIGVDKGTVTLLDAGSFLLKPSEILTA